MLKLASLIVLVLGVAQGHMEFSADLLTQLATDEPLFCIPYYLMMSQQCVNAPKLFNPSMFKGCKPGGDREHGKHGGAKRNLRMSRRPNSRVAREARKSRNGQDKTMNQKLRKMAAQLTSKRAGCDGNCMAECVMNKTGHLNQNGDIILANLLANYTNALETLTAESKAVWSPLIANIINTCMTNVMKTTELIASTTANPSTSSPAIVEPKKICKSDSRRLMTCIQREYVLQAPASEKHGATDMPPIDPKMPSCENRTAQLKGCDYNYMLTPEQFKKYFGSEKNEAPKKTGFRSRASKLTEGNNEGVGKSSEEVGGQGASKSKLSGKLTQEGKNSPGSSEEVGGQGASKSKLAAKLTQNKNRGGPGSSEEQVVVSPIPPMA